MVLVVCVALGPSLSHMISHFILHGIIPYMGIAMELRLSIEEIHHG